LISAKSIIYFFLFFFFFIFKLYSTNLAAINIDYVLKNNPSFSAFIVNLNTYKIDFEKNIKLLENKLLKLQNEIQELKLILSDDEINLKFEKYDKDLIFLKDKIDNFNFFINSNIDNSRSLMINEILKISKNIATVQNYDLILDENNYLLISEKIDISNLVIKELNTLNLTLKVVNNNENFYK